MDRKLVRTAAAEWLTAAQIPGLLKVHRGKVQVAAPQFTAGGPLARAIGYVLLDARGRGRERRIAMAGPTDGQKEVDHLLTVVLNFWAPSPAGDSDWLDSQDAFDDIIDTVLDQVRGGGRVLDRGDKILQAGEGPYGIDYQVTEPLTLNGGLLAAVCDINFQVSEIINT